MKKIEKEFNKLLFTEMVLSVIYGVVGLIIFLNSEMTNQVVGTIIGTFFLLYGVFSIFTSLDKIKIKLFKYNLFFGIASFLLGFFIMFNPLTLLNFLNISLGIWLFVEGINKIVYFLFLRKIKEESNRIFLVTAIFLVLLGILIIVDPFRTLIVTKTIGIFIVLYNILNLNDLVLLKRRSKVFLKSLSK